MSRQMMNAIAAISQVNNVIKRINIRLDRLYIAYNRSCMVATEQHQLCTHFADGNQGPCVAHEYTSAPQARSWKSRIPSLTVNLNGGLSHSRIRTSNRKGDVQVRSL